MILHYYSQERICSCSRGNTAAFSIYNMEIKRPEIEWRKVCIHICVVLINDIVLSYIILQMISQLGIAKQADKYLTIIRYIFFLPISGLDAKVFSTIVFISMIINLKSLMIFSILLYQRFAPEPMRASCLYIPSCSEYMILAIKKYGCVKGFIKGVNRLRRCHVPNGGIDYP